MNNAFPPDIRYELEGWQLKWYQLRSTDQVQEKLMELGQKTFATVRKTYETQPITKNPDVKAMRQLFRKAGCDPTRYRPSSEALLRRVLKGDNLPSIHPLVDINNLFSILLPAPCCVIDATSVKPPFTLRAGDAGESMQSLRGPFQLEGKPLLEDQEGPFGTPITDSERVRVTEATQEAWLVAYLPKRAIQENPDGILDELLLAAPVARATHA